MTATADPIKERQQLLDQADEIVKGAKADGRDVLSDEERGKVADALKSAGELAAGIIAGQETGDILKDLETAKGTNLERGADDERQKGSAKLLEAMGLKSPGMIFAESAEYKGLLERNPNGFSEKTVPQMDPVSIGSLEGMKAAAYGQKAVVNVGTGSNASGNAVPMVVPDNRGLLAPLFLPQTVLDLVTGGTTGSDTVEFYQEVEADRVNAADPVGEATATGGASGLKPESAVRFIKVSNPVKTIATWIPITRKALADVGQIRTILDAYLLQFLRETLEDEVLNGDGTGEHLTGIRTTASATQAFDTDVFVTSRKGLTQIRLNKVQPTGFVFNPVDVETIDLTQDGNGRYYGQGPFGIGPRTLWGLPVAESPSQPAGEGLLGDFRQAILYDREQASVQTGTINDQFVRNMLTLLAELRAALAIQRATAFRKLDLTA